MKEWLEKQKGMSQREAQVWMELVTAGAKAYGVTARVIDSGVASKITRLMARATGEWLQAMSDAFKALGDESLTPEEAVKRSADILATVEAA